MNARELQLGIPDGPARIGVVAARFNQFITEQLLAGSLEALSRHGVKDEDICLAWVPGAFELPLAADSMLASGDFDGIIALGAVIRGGTPHFDYVAGECSRGLADVALKRGKPVVFGVLTTDTVEQALERAAVSEGNKGHDVAVAVLNMIHLQRSLAASGGPDEQ